MSNVVTINGGANLTDKMKKIQTAIERIRTSKEERAEINADMLSVREGMAALGIPKAAFDMALRYLDWEPEKRQGFDVAYALVREAGGLPMQSDLFSSATKLASDVAEKQDAAKPSERDIAERKMEALTRDKKMTGDTKAPPAPPAPDAGGIADHLGKEKKTDAKK